MKYLKFAWSKLQLTNCFLKHSKWIKIHAVVTSEFFLTLYSGISQPNLVPILALVITIFSNSLMCFGMYAFCWHRSPPTYNNNIFVSNTWTELNTWTLLQKLLSPSTIKLPNAMGDYGEFRYVRIGRLCSVDIFSFGTKIIILSGRTSKL